jgi:hypothetical protein
LITRANASDEEVDGLRHVLEKAVTDPALTETRDTLSLIGFAVLSDTDYEPLAEFEREADRLNYPAVA